MLDAPRRQRVEHGTEPCDAAMRGPDGITEAPHGVGLAGALDASLDLARRRCDIVGTRIHADGDSARQSLAQVRM